MTPLNLTPNGNGFIFARGEDGRRVGPLVLRVELGQWTRGGSRWDLNGTALTPFTAHLVGPWIEPVPATPTGPLDEDGVPIDLPGDRERRNAMREAERRRILASSPEVDEVRKALEPFAATADDMQMLPDDEVLLLKSEHISDFTLTVGDLRRARTALEALQRQTEQLASVYATAEADAKARTQGLNLDGSERREASSEAAPVARGEVGWRVRKLEWGDSKSHRGRVRVGYDPNGKALAYVYYDANREDANSQRIQGEMAEAQADFERHILSAIEQPPAEPSEAVAVPEGEVERLTRERDEAREGRWIGGAEQHARNLTSNLEEWKAHAKTAEATIAELRERLETVEGAAGPFAEHPYADADNGPIGIPDGHFVISPFPLSQHEGITVGHFRALRAALSPAQETGR